MGQIQDRLRELEITLPEAISPVANYVTAKRSGNWLWISGHISRRDGEVVTGRFGTDLDAATGWELARNVAIDILATASSAIGDLEKVRQVVKLTGMVNCASDFTKQSAVIDGASQLFVEVFGEERGRHARSAIGVASLPLGAALEVEAIFEVE